MKFISFFNKFIYFMNFSSFYNAFVFIKVLFVPVAFCCLKRLYRTLQMIYLPILDLTLDSLWLFAESSMSESCSDPFESSVSKISKILDLYSLIFSSNSISSVISLHSWYPFFFPSSISLLISSRVMPLFWTFGFWLWAFPWLSLASSWSLEFSLLSSFSDLELVMLYHVITGISG